MRVAHVEPHRREAWCSLVEELTGDEALRGVVHLSGLDGSGEEATAEGLFGEAEHGYASALALVQGLLDADVSPTGGMWLVTRGAQAVGCERDGVLSGAALWGLGRTVALEAPGLGVRLVDLDPEGEPDAGALVEELLCADRETQVAHRAGVRHAARLVRGLTTDESARAARSEPATVGGPCPRCRAGRFGAICRHGSSSAVIPAKAGIHESRGGRGASVHGPAARGRDVSGDGRSRGDWT